MPRYFLFHVNKRWQNATCIEASDIEESTRTSFWRDE